QVLEIHEAIAIQVGFWVGAKELRLQRRQVLLADGIVLVEVRVAKVAEAVGVGVALVGVCDEGAVVAIVGDVISVRVRRGLGSSRAGDEADDEAGDEACDQPANSRTESAATPLISAEATVHGSFLHTEEQAGRGTRAPAPTT